MFRLSVCDEISRGWKTTVYSRVNSPNIRRGALWIGRALLDHRFDVLQILAISPNRRPSSHWTERVPCEGRPFVSSVDHERRTHRGCHRRSRLGPRARGPRGRGGVGLHPRRPLALVAEARQEPPGHRHHPGLRRHARVPQGTHRADGQGLPQVRRGIHR